MAYSKLGDDWLVGAAGMRWRRAARVILMQLPEPSSDAQEPKLLLVRGHDADNPTRSWWFTVGGGIDKGETARQAAVREVREETGIILTEKDLIGPVIRRDAIFDFTSETCRQFEEFFIAIVPAEIADSATTKAGWTELENDLLDELAWLTPTGLKTQELEYFPPELPHIVARLAAQIVGTGWDGKAVNLGSRSEQRASLPGGDWDGRVIDLGTQDDDRLGRS